LGNNSRRSCFDLQIPLDNRNNVQKAETEFSVAFFLFRNGKRHKNAGLVYAYSTFVIDCNTCNIKKQKSIFNCGSVDQNTPDKPFRHKMGGC